MWSINSLGVKDIELIPKNLYGTNIVCRMNKEYASSLLHICAHYPKGNIDATVTTKIYTYCLFS